MPTPAPTITPALLDFMRTSYASAPIDDLLAQRRIERLDLPVPGHLGDEIVVSVLIALSGPPDSAHRRAIRQNMADWL